MGVFTLFHWEEDPDAKGNCKFPSQLLWLASAIVNSKDINTIDIFLQFLPETNLIYFWQVRSEHVGMDNYFFDLNANSIGTVQDFGGEIWYVNFIDIIHLIAYLK